MSKYGTDRAFGGRRARVGDTVILAVPSKGAGWRTCQVCSLGACRGHDLTVLRAGVVGAISETVDLPRLRDFRAEMCGEDPYRESTDLVFVETDSEDQVEALEIGQWTWPLPH